MKENKTFYNWIVEMAEDPTDDPAGDFILDAEVDSFFPRDTKADEHGFITIINYLYFNYGSWLYVLDAFMDVWQVYYKDVTGKDWIEPGYSKWGDEIPERIEYDFKVRHLATIEMNNEVNCKDNE